MDRHRRTGRRAPVGWRRDALHHEAGAGERLRARLLRRPRRRHLDRHRRRPEPLAAAAVFRISTPRTAWPTAAFARCCWTATAACGWPPTAASATFATGPFVADPLLARLRGEKIWALHQDADGGLWIGTHGAGLFLLKAGTLLPFSPRNGLPSNKIHFISRRSRAAICG